VCQRLCRYTFSNSTRSNRAKGEVSERLVHTRPNRPASLFRPCGAAGLVVGGLMAYRFDLVAALLRVHQRDAAVSFEGAYLNVDAYVVGLTRLGF
jgi:hypothetical protein